MIRLPKIFNKNNTNSQDSRNFSSGNTRNSRSNSEDVDPSEITEDPEKQKARHRLLGASVLVLIAIVGLPKVFDSQPKKINNDVVLQMVASAVEPPKETDKSSNAKVESNKDSIPSSQKDSNPAPEVKSEAVVESTKKTVDKTLEKGEEVVEEVKPKKSTTNVKYVLQIGSFSTQEKIKKLGARLKEQKIPYFSEEKTKDDTKSFLMRAGPFSEKGEAEAAEKKIRAMGLTPKLVEVTK